MAVPTYPGVYIEEFTPAAPIEGVGTSTAAFIGVSPYGKPNEPVRITNWERLLREFWVPDPNVTPGDSDYLWYAVRGFFQNGGRDCFVVAVSNAQPDFVVLNDTASGGGRPTVRVYAREAKANSGIRVKAEAQSAVSAGRFFRPQATVVAGSSNVIEVDSESSALKFLVGDIVRVTANGNNPNSESAVVRSIDGKLLRLASNLANTYQAGNLQLDALPTGATTFRAEDVDQLAAGSAVRISQTGKPPVDCQVTEVVAERISSGINSYRVTVDKPLDGFDLLATSDINVVSQEFKLTVRPPAGVEEIHQNLAMDPGHPRYFARIIAVESTLVSAEGVEPPNTTPTPNNRPQSLGGNNQPRFVALDRGANFDPSTLRAADYLRALAPLERIDDINLVCAPGRTDQDVQRALISHCEKLQDRFALLDSDRLAPIFGAGSVELQLRRVVSARGYAALYYPWLTVTSMKSGQPILVPPTGHTAGVIARTDNMRGVHKAPAGIEAALSGVLGIATPMSDDEQGLLNKIGVNVIRVFQQGGVPVVWGARTTSTTENTNWQYVNIRRLFIFLEESIQQGIRGSVFEPNNPSLWQKLRRTIGAFLTQQWRDGALFGNRAEEAFYVRIDEVLNPPSQRALGRLTIEIGVRPSYPAEFIIVRIGIWQGGSSVTEV